MNHARLLRPAFLSLALLGALALATGAQEDPNPATPEAGKKDDAGAARDFSGKSLADGMSNGGKPYKAMVEITRDGDVYQVVWVLGPREAYMGVGVIEGDALCVGWAVGEVPGVVVYKGDPEKGDKNKDGKNLVGRWTAPGSKGKTFGEKLMYIP